MALRERLDEDLKKAMKARDDVGLSVIRMVRATVKNREIERRTTLDDAGIAEVISGLVKQRRESIRLFGEAGRDELVAKEEKELALLLGFLPRQLSEEEIGEIVMEAIAATGATGPKELGVVMKAVMPRTAGVADGAVVSRIVRERLA